MTTTPTNSKAAAHVSRTPRPADLFEAVFDISYLVFDLIAAIIFFIWANGRVLFDLYGILTLVLCIGDAFHLVPRVVRALRGTNPQIKRYLGRGLQISSITMTVFYILLMYIWKETFPQFSLVPAIVYAVWISATIRIIICLLPQNDWTGDNSQKSSAPQASDTKQTNGAPQASDTKQASDTLRLRMSIMRNAVFVVTGLCIMWLYASSGTAHGLEMQRMVWAIAISFACYLPVTVLSRRYPLVGMLMIPKTCAYIWMIVMGLQLLF